MCNEKKFYICKESGNFIGTIHPLVKNSPCCGGSMEAVIANVEEASTEKHIPVATIDGNTVTVSVGSVIHPMSDEHHIGWVYLETKAGSQYKHLPVDKDPVVTFALTDGDQVTAVYAYCNIHGLWKADL